MVTKIDPEKKKIYIDEMLKVIDAEKIVFFDHSFAYTTFGRSTAYSYDLNEVDEIKEAINRNKVEIKSKMIKTWVKSENATLQISAYRLLSSHEEHMKLNQSYVDHTTKGNEVKAINLQNYTDDELRTIAELQRKGGTSEA